MNKTSTLLAPDRFDAVLFDLDGVVTRTARLHAQAWKAIFDAYLAERPEREGEDHHPFAIDDDYPRYVDGKPRLAGVRDFLASRGIDLPPGTTGDPPEAETVRGLGERKNRRYLRLLEAQGAQTYPATIGLLRRLRRAGLATALFSASKNARAVLDAAGATALFDAVVDGADAEELGLAGKPAPDVLLEAARRLGAEPGRTVVVEDAPAGVEAGRAGGFGLVIGIDRRGRPQDLAPFADLVVADLAEIAVAGGGTERTTARLPSALDRFTELVGRLEGRPPAVFLDYDGTLTPIVERPEQARIDAAMRRSVQALARRCTVAIVSGRDRRDVERLAGIDGICYAGSHGLDIAGPEGRELEFQQGRDCLPALERAEAALRERLEPISGAQIERKKYAIAVHFRRVAAAERPEVEAAVDAVLAESDGLRKTGGKMIHELRPDLDWDKGKALAWLMRQLGLDRRAVVPVYLGDDLTDEDALREIEEDGIGILVRDEDRPTHARYALENPDEVGAFLRRLDGLLQRRGER